MNIRLWSCASTMVSCVLSTTAAVAQSEPSTKPSEAEVTFVRGEKDWPASSWRVLPKWMATFTTRPSVSPFEGAVVSAAFGEVFQNARVESRPGFRSQSAEITAFVDSLQRAEVHHWQRTKNGSTEDRWTVLGFSEEAVTALSKAVVRACRGAFAPPQSFKTQLQSLMQRIDERVQGIPVFEAQLAQAGEETRRLGVTSMTDDEVSSAAARLDQEQRLNAVDIAGLEASIGATQKRMAALPGASRRNESDVEVARTLCRIQVELEIQLAGKLARKTALSNELERVQAGREARARATKLRQEIAESRQAVEADRTALHEVQEQLVAWESVATVTVVDDRVVVSPTGY